VHVVIEGRRLFSFCRPFPTFFWFACSPGELLFRAPLAFCAPPPCFFNRGVLPSLFPPLSGCELAWATSGSGRLVASSLPPPPLVHMPLGSRHDPSEDRPSFKLLKLCPFPLADMHVTSLCLLSFYTLSMMRSSRLSSREVLRLSVAPLLTAMVHF